jgi:hypothetical protein
MAMNQVTMPKTAPIGPYVLLRARDRERAGGDEEQAGDGRGVR